MKKIQSLLIALFSITTVFSQTFNSEVGASFEKKNKKEVYSIHFPSAYGFMTLHHLENEMMDNQKNMVLTKYDQSMKAVETTEFQLPKLGLRASDLKEVIELENRLIVLSTVMDKKSAKHDVNAQVYNQEDDSVSENKILASFAIKGYSKSGFYQIAVSPDKSKIAIVANHPFKKKTQEVVQIWVYDNELNLLWEQTETLSYKSERAYQEQIFALNSGDVVMNKTSNAFKKTRKSELLTFNGTTVSTSSFSADGFKPMNMKLIDVNGIPMLAGFYWDGLKLIIQLNSKEGNANDGAFLYDISEQKLIGKHAWSEQVDWRDLKSLEVIDAMVINDDIYMIGEKQLETSEFRKTGNSMSMEIDYTYTFGSSVIVNMDTKGTLKSFKPYMSGRKYMNEAKERGSAKALYIDNGLRLFSNNTKVRLDTFFTDAETTFNPPSVRLSSGSSLATPYIVPNSLRRVEKYNLAYYIVNYGKKYWVTKMTW